LPSIGGTEKGSLAVELRPESQLSLAAVFFYFFIFGSHGYFSATLLNNQQHGYLYAVGLRRAADAVEVLGVVHVRSFVVCVLSFVPVVFVFVFSRFAS